MKPYHLSESFKGRIKQAEKKLNHLCCEHDSLMPVVEIYEACSSNLHRWQNTLKHIQRKIHQYHISNQQKRQSEDSSKVAREEQQQQRITLVHQKLKSIQQTLQQCKQPLQREKAQVDNVCDWRREVEDAVQEVRRYAQISLASFSNQVELTLKKQEDKSLNPELFKPIEKQLVCSVEREYKGLRYQLERIKAELGDADLQEFHKFTFGRLGCELIEINEIVEDIYASININSILNQCWHEKVSFVQHRLDLVHWQIEGLKKRYLHNLMSMYQSAPEKYEVHCLEKKLLHDVKQLRSTFQVVSDKVDFLLKQLSKP